MGNDWRYRNSRKFYLKYGFDPHRFADGWALGLYHDDLAQFLCVHPSILENFMSDQFKRKSSQIRYTVHHI